MIVGQVSIGEAHRADGLGRTVFDDRAADNRTADQHFIIYITDIDLNCISITLCSASTRITKIIGDDSQSVSSSTIYIQITCI